MMGQGMGPGMMGPGMMGPGMIGPGLLGTGAMGQGMAPGMVMMSGTTASRVPSPTSTNVEQITSANTARLSDTAGPIPNTSRNWISPPAISL